jgi:hypothetical protein
VTGLLASSPSAHSDPVVSRNCLELRGGQAEARRGAERVALGPLKVLQARLGHGVAGGRGVLVPGILAAHNLFGRELRHAAQTHFGAGLLSAGDDGLDQLVHVAGGRVVDDGKARHGGDSSGLS